MPARTSDMVDVVEQRAADVVCISALPPLAVAHARNSYRRLVARFPRLPLIIGLWNASKPLEEARRRMGSDATTPIVKTLKDALAELDRIARTRPLRDAGSAPGPTGAAAVGS